LTIAEHPGIGDRVAFMRRMALFSFVAVALLAVTAGSVSALTLLTTDKVAAFEHDGGTGAGSAWIRVGRDRGLDDLSDPTVCPASATFQVSSYPSTTSLIVGDPPVPLPCERWHRIPDGYAYFDPTGAAGGVRSLRYTQEGLWVRLAGPGYRPVVGPVGYAQIWLTVGDERYLVRFHEFVQNDERRVVAQRPTPQAAKAEAAFWDTLWGDAPRKDESIRLLSDAVARDRFDGRSQFLLAMMRLYRFGEQVTSAESITPRAEREVVAATRAFARAVPLLWKDGKGDSRVPGFAAAATYARGIAENDPDWIQRGLEELDAAVEINHLFNSFDKLGVAGFIAGTDPQYQEILALLDGFDAILGLCGGQDEICFNSGMAPHNIEGTFLLFGDVYAKGGRVADAREWYGLSANVGSSSGWKYLATAQARFANVEGRVALYRDADPSNDPALAGAGNGNGASCAYCHNK
jgi:hypothetical protein